MGIPILLKTNNVLSESFKWKISRAHNINEEDLVMNKVDFIRGEMMAAMKARDKERKAA